MSAQGAGSPGPERVRCEECGTEVAPRLLSCPACRRLVHAGELRRLAAHADERERSGALREALVARREMLDLLPPRSRQHETLLRRVETLSRSVETGDAPGGGGRARWAAAGATLGAGALLLWKLKFVVGFALTKGKLLLLGLTKSTTLFSMLLSTGVYWTAWGWKFALGLVASIYVHEIGHVAALQRLGIRASAPMFIPGLGAMVRSDQYPASPREDARVGLAGPLWGLGAALCTWGAHLLTGWDSLAAIARVAAWLNLFNLLPVWHLDGARGFRALGARERWWIVAVMVALWLATAESLLVLLALAGAVHAVTAARPEQSDRRAFVELALLLAALSALCLIEVGVPGATPGGAG